MLLYPVRLLIISFLYNTYYAWLFNFKATFLIATIAFNLANRGRIAFESLLPLFDSVNTTGIAFGATTVQLVTDIVGGIIVGVPGNYSVSSIITMYDNKIYVPP